MSIKINSRIIFIFCFFIFYFIFVIFNVRAEDFEKYYVIKVIDSDDKVIVEDHWGDQYLVEYGIGCLSMWRYEGKYIYINKGLYLDGIGDTIYLLDSDDDCKVWDADELDSSGSGFYSGSSYTPTYIPPTPCPSNSTAIGSQCYCNAGYQSNLTKNGCVLVVNTSTSPYQNVREHKIYRDVRIRQVYNTDLSCTQLSLTGEDLAMCEGFSSDSNKDRWVTIERSTATPGPSFSAAVPTDDPVDLCIKKLGPQGKVVGQACGCIDGFTLNTDKSYCIPVPSVNAANTFSAQQSTKKEQLAPKSPLDKPKEVPKPKITKATSAQAAIVASSTTTQKTSPSKFSSWLKKLFKR